MDPPPFRSASTPRPVSNAVAKRVAATATELVETAEKLYTKLQQGHVMMHG